MAKSKIDGKLEYQLEKYQKERISTHDAKVIQDLIAQVQIETVEEVLAEGLFTLAIYVLMTDF